MDIKDFDLTEEDFVLIMKGLEYLPSSGLAGELVSKLLLDTMSTDRNVKARIESEMKAKERRREHEKELLIEEVRFLLGKLIGIKRKLMEAGALRQAADALKRGSA